MQKRFRTVKIDGFTFSLGNSKLGGIPNFSKLPGRDCGPNSRHCAPGCYAVKLIRAYATAFSAWGANGQLAKDLGLLESAASQFLSRYQPRYFRIHVSGDFTSQPEVNMWFRLGRKFPQVRFLAFTKSFHLQFGRAPENMKIWLSMWPGMTDRLPARLRAYPRIWLSTDTRVPADKAVPCAGRCDSCALCWHADGVDVVFHPH